MDQAEYHYKRLKEEIRTIKKVLKGKTDFLTAAQKEYFSEKTKLELENLLNETIADKEKLRKAMRENDEKQYKEWVEHKRLMKTSFLAGGANLGQYDDAWEREKH